MDEDRAVDAAAVLDGKRTLGEWTLSRLRAEDIGTFCEWVRDRRETEARKAMRNARGLTAEQREMTVATLRARPVSWSDIYEQMVTPEGFERIILLSVQIKHPNVTADDLRECDAFERGGAVSLVLWVFGLDTVGKGGEPTGSGPRQEAPPDPPTEGAAS